MAPWQDVLEHVVRDRRAALVGYAYLFVLDKADAEDLVQDALVRTFARPRTMTDPHTAEGYVRRAIRTSFLDRARRHRTWRQKAHLVVGEGTARGPEDAVVAQVDVTAALVGLTPRERACIVLRHFDDLTVPEVAAELNLSDGAVKRYLSDATRKLRATLGSAVTVPPDLDPTIPVDATGRSLR